MQTSNEASSLESDIKLLPQEIPLDDPNSRFRFNPLEKQLITTRGVIEAFGFKTIGDCMELLQQQVDAHDGLDYLQVFTVGPAKKKLWVIEDHEAITALLPDEY